jgi:aspartokinase
VSGKILVLKFGGTPLGTPARARRAARRARSHRWPGRQPVVVSANGDTTGRILGRLRLEVVA